MLGKSLGWTARKYEWAVKREYNQRRNSQYDLFSAVNQSLSDLISSMSKNSGERQNMLLPALEDAIKESKHEVEPDGVDHSLWWQPKNT